MVLFFIDIRIEDFFYFYFVILVHLLAMDTALCFLSTELQNKFVMHYPSLPNLSSIFVDLSTSLIYYE